MNTDLIRMSAPAAFLVERKLSSQVSLKAENWIGLETGYRGQGVSPNHCVIKFFEKQFYVTDLNSTTGTFLNNFRMVPQQWYPLNPGDNLQVGIFGFQFSAVSLAKPVSPVKAVSSGLAPAPEAKKFETHLVSNLDEASYGTRFLAALADNLLMTMASAAILFMLPSKPAFSTAVPLIAYLLLTALPMVTKGQTMGKKLFGIRVVQADGSNVTAWKIFQREIIIRLGVLMLVVGFLGILSRVSEAAFLISFLTFPILFIYKAKRDGDMFWDVGADTKVICD